MPILKSSKKALKVSKRRRKENLTNLSSYKAAIKEVRKSIESKKTDKLEEQLKNAKSVIDKAAKNKTIHKNKAARLKSRLAKKVVSQKTTKK